MGPHRGSQDDPATGDKKFQGSKKDDYQLKKEIKNTSSRGKNKTERDLNGTPLGITTFDHATRDKNCSKYCKDNSVNNDTNQLLIPIDVLPKTQGRGIFL